MNSRRLPPEMAKVKAPRILVEALKLYGVRETPGPQHNPVIMAWAHEVLDKKSGARDWYDADEKAWCGLFMAVCAKRAGFVPPDGFSALRARDWAKWGDPVSGHPGRGDVLVFERTGGGHVGLYWGEDESCFHVIGGNQSNMVRVSRIEKSRMVMARRSPGIKSAQRCWMNAAGEVSKNEA